MRTRHSLGQIMAWMAVGLLACCCLWAQDPGDVGDEGVDAETYEEGAEEPPPEEEYVEEEEFVEEEAYEEESIPEEVGRPQIPEPPSRAPVRPSLIRPKTVRPVLRPSDRAGAPPAPRSVPSRSGPEPRSTPASAQPPEQKDGKVPDVPVAFDFPDTPLMQVIESIAKMTGRNFDVDPNIGATRVTIITHDKIPPDMAYEVLESILNSRGFSMVETLDGHLIKIVPTGELGEKVPIAHGTESVPPAFDELSTHIVTVQHADASELASILSSLGSNAAKIDAYVSTNTLIITDTADGLRRMFAFLEEVDIPGFDTEMEIFTLEYTRAEILAEQIQEVLLEGGTTSSTTTRTTSTIRRPTTTTRRPPIRPSVPGQTQPMVIGERSEVLRIVPDERLNSLIVIATDALMERVRDLVGKLDTPTPYESNNMHVYELLNADAEQVEQALSGLIGGAAPRQASAKGGQGTTGEVQPFEKKVVITRYEQTNALLILASPQDYKLIREIIAQLDVPQRQVLVEAVIMDVSIQNDFSLTVDAAKITPSDGFVLGDTSSIADLVSTTDLATSLASGTASLSLAAAAMGLGGPGITAGLYDHIETKIGGQKVRVPFVPLLVQALETLTDLDILSRPSLTARDNEPADIVIGQEVPVPTQRSGYSYYNDGSETTNTPYRNYSSSYGRGISREDVGVKMSVTPHINEGDYVTLETEIEVSETTGSSVDIDVNELGPTFNKSQIKNNVVVKDGATGVIGGLIKETTTHTTNQAPGLGDIPILGFLFRNKTNSRRKQNVVVLITPHIIKEGSDLERVSQYKMEDFHNANVDALFEEGIIKKVKRRHHMRSKHRPSVSHSEELMNQQGFGRGDLKR